MIKPHTMSLISALLAGCAATLLTLAHHEPKAALAAGYALLAGVTSLALYLSSRQAARASEKELREAVTSRLAEPVAEAEPAEVIEGKVKRAPRRSSNVATNVVKKPLVNGEKKVGHYPRYTSQSRA